MRFLWSGYGSGSSAGTGESKQYKTLRGNAAVGAPKVRRDGVVSGDKELPSITINGSTRKRSKDADNNDMSLIVFGMTKGEAWMVAARFIEYARLVERGPSAHQQEGADALLKVMEDVMYFASKEAVGELLSGVAASWEKCAASQESIADKWRARGATGEAWAEEGAWHRSCASTIRNLVTIFQNRRFGERPTKGPKAVV